MKLKWKISSKIMVAIMISSAALAAVIGSIALYQASNVIEKSAMNNLKARAESYANEFSITTGNVESVLDSYIASISASINLDKVYNDQEYLKIYQEDTLVPLTRKFAENTGGILGIYFDIDPSVTPYLLEDESVYGAWLLDRNLTGKIVREELEIKKNFYPENEKMQWYYAPLKKQKGVWSKPYRDIYTGYYMISYNKPVVIEDTLIGVAGIDIIFEDIMTMVESVQLFETGYAFLLDEDMDFIVHPQMKDDTEWGDQKLSGIKDSLYKALAEKISKESSGIDEIGTGYNKTFVGFAHMNNGYVVGIEVKSTEVLEELNKVRSIIDIIILAGILMSAIAAYILGKFISKPVERLGKMIKRMMHFDFSSEINDVQLVNTESDSGRMIVELSKLRDSVNHSIMMFRSNSHLIHNSGEKIEKILENSMALLERMELMHEIESKGTPIQDDIQLEKDLILEIKKMIQELNGINEKNIKITDLYKTD